MKENSVPLSGISMGKWHFNGILKEFIESSIKIPFEDSSKMSPTHANSSNGTEFSFISL